MPGLAGTDGGGMQVDDDIGDLDGTQVVEPGSKRLKESNAATDLLVRCAETLHTKQPVK